MIDIDTQQWRAMHSLCVKNMMRSSGVLRMDRRSEPISRRGEVRETISSFLGYALLSAVIASAVATATHPVGEFIAISFLSLLVYSGVSEHSSNLLFAKKELHAFGALPISASTYLASKISGTIVYQLLVCSALASPAFFVILIKHGLFAGISWIVSVAFCVVFLCFAAICVHSFSGPKFRDATFKLGLSKTIFWTSVSAIFLVIWIVVLLPDFELSELGESWNLNESSLFLLFPPYWFISLLLLLGGQFTFTSIIGSLLAIFGTVPMCLYLLVRINTAFLASLCDTTSSAYVTSRRPNKRSLYRWLKFGSLGYERTAVWKLAFSHLKYDTTFQTVWFAYFPMFCVIFALVFVSNAEPWNGSFSSSELALLLTWSCCVIFFYEFVLFEALRTSGCATACWVLFVAPSNLTRFTALGLDWLFVVFVVPVIILFGVVFGYFSQAPTIALLYTFTLGWLSYTALNIKSTVIPALPFTRQIRASRTSPRLCLNFLFVGICGVVVYHAFASWIYLNYITYVASSILGIGICIAVRFLAAMRYDQKYLLADLTT